MYRNRFAIMLFLTLLHLLWPVSNTEAYSVVTHRGLSNMAIQNSYLSDANYLKSIGINSIEEEFNSNNPIQWIEQGADEEDSLLTLRPRNHFHNPLRSWADAGLDDSLSGQSSLLWAQEASNEFSWQNARQYFHNALTSSSVESRETGFANTFETLGHLLHLVQDCACPPHTRNDAHVFIASGYEGWAKDNPGTVLSYVSPFVVDVDLGVSVEGYEPITQLFDANQYTGAAPSTSNAQGLAEYTNANFASEDTIFTENFSPDHIHYFPFPRRTDAEEYEQDMGGKLRTYFRKTQNGEAIEHFAVAGRFYRYLPWWPEVQIYFIGFDDLCHADYAQKLIPRAVGYSAGLLDYFFRGDMDLIENPDNPEGYVIQNKTEEEMVGTFELYYDNENDERVKVPEENGGFPVETSIPAGGKSGNIDFTPPDDAKEPGKYILVFRGQMGSETDAVVGKVVDGIKIYDEYYLLLKATSFGSGVWYTIWDIPHNRVATNLFWEDEEIGRTEFEFPMEADLYDTEDPLYRWLINRPWDESVPEIDRHGFPAVQTEQGLVYVAMGAQEGSMSGYNLPAATTDCLVSCGSHQWPDPADANAEDSCYQEDSNTLPARNAFNTVYGLVNTATKTDNWSCTNSGAPVPITETENRNLITVRELAALFPAQEYDSGITSTGPFKSRGIARPDDSEVLISDAIVLQSQVYTQSEILDANTITTCDTYGCSGHRTNTYQEDYVYSFQTPLGPLNEISTMGSRTVVATPFATYMCSISQWTYETTYAGVGAISGDIDWGGLGTQKNQMMCFYTPKVMFQTYYYSTRIGYQCPPGSPVQWTENFTNVAASVEYYPEGDAGEADPLRMTINLDFETAIMDLFQEAMGDSTTPDDSVRHFAIAVYN